MKKAFIISLLSLATLSAHAQYNEQANTPPRVDDSVNFLMPAESQTFVDTLSLSTMPATTGAACRKSPDMPKRAVPTWPKKTEYTSILDPSCAPCYQYTTKRGLKVMECPFVHLAPESIKPEREFRTASITTMKHKLYTGNYPNCRRDPDMPRRAKPAWPKKAEYTPIGDPKCAPCYQYTTKRGLKVMECPNLWLTPQQ